MSNQQYAKGKLTGALIVLSATMMIACASTSREPAQQHISNAQLTISQAEQSNARQYAPLDLRLANEKLADARDAFNNENYEKANNLAEEALVNAKLAASKSDTAKTRETVQNLQSSIAQLRQQIQVNQNQQQQ